MPSLLIVPYGIETVYGELFGVLTILLIVPYGIETREVQLEERIERSFNRTLWN